MAQTSFDIGRAAMSDALVATLARATEYAVGQSHGIVTLEHLLLSLTEDADAAHVLEASSVDLTRLRNDVASFIGQQPPNARGGQPELDPDLSKILTYAEAAARQSGRTEINGAIVLAAIVGEGRSMAATFLKAQGLTFQAAIRAIKQALAPTPQTPSSSAPASESPAAEVSEPPAPTPPPSMVPRDRARPGVSQSSQPPLPEPQRPQREILGIPSIRPAPAPRPEPARKAAEPAPQSPAPRPPDPPSETASQTERPSSHPEVPEARAEPPRPAPPSPPMPEPPTIARPAAPPRQPPPSPPPSAPAASGPPPLPSRDAGRRLPEGPPPVPPPLPQAPGLGSARPPPPRPNLRLPPSQPAGQAEETPIIAPWPAETNDLRMPPPPPPPRAAAHGVPSPEHDHRAARAGRPAPPRERPAIEKGQLVESIPRRMKVGVIETFEIRIARDGVVEAGRGLAGRGAPQHHQILITRAMSVRLQCEPGRFYIEAASPETQWTGTRSDQLASDYAVWRFTVIPQRRGPAELMLIVSARTIGADGIVADTSLPEQRIAIRVSANVTRGLKRWLGWIMVALIGAAVGKIGESFWEQALSFVRQTLAI